MRPLAERTTSVVRLPCRGDDPAHDIGGESARDQETHLLDRLLGVLRRRIEFSAPHVLCTGLFALAQFGHGLRDQFGGQTLGLQFLADSRGTQLGRTPMHDRSRHTRFTDVALGLQLIEHGLDLSLIHI